MMTNRVAKILAFGAAITASAMSVAPAFAQDDGDVMYERYYYDDPAMTIQVGYERDTCTRYGVGGGRTQGRYGPYVQYNPIAICRNGQLYPY